MPLIYLCEDITVIQYILYTVNCIKEFVFLSISYLVLCVDVDRIFLFFAVAWLVGLNHCNWINSKWINGEK